MDNNSHSPQQKPTTNKPNMFALFKDYKLLVGGIVLASLIGNGLNLLLPKLMGWTIDSYLRQTGQLNGLLWQFGLVIGGILIASTVQMVIQIKTAEKVAFDLRNRLAQAISHHSSTEILQRTPAT